MPRERPPSTTGSGTERVNPRTRDLDRLETSELVARILDEDSAVTAAVRGALPSIVRACERLSAALEAGGRWVNLGAGTSGRIGVLDAAEIPPTFGLDPDRVQGRIAGGEAALRSAVEGAEDDRGAARRDVADLRPPDVLLGLSASGRTPYVLAGLEAARESGVTTLAITCDPRSPLARLAEIVIATEVGPEVIAGSTRMKGGLAQKMVLHTLSTATMVRLGRVRGNLMTGVRAVNEKLRARALRILAELSGCTPERARSALEESDGSVERALALLAPPDEGC